MSQGDDLQPLQPEKPQKESKGRRYRELHETRENIQRAASQELFEIPRPSQKRKFLLVGQVHVTGVARKVSFLMANCFADEGKCLQSKMKAHTPSSHKRMGCRDEEGNQTQAQVQL